MEERTEENLKAGLYRHYKGGVYQLIGVGQHSENEEKLIVYVALSVDHPGPRIRCRPIRMWDEIVIWPDDTTGPRFKWIGTELPCQTP